MGVTRLYHPVFFIVTNGMIFLESVAEKLQKLIIIQQNLFQNYCRPSLRPVAIAAQSGNLCPIKRLTG